MEKDLVNKNGADRGYSNREEASDNSCKTTTLFDGFIMNKNDLSTMSKDDLIKSLSAVDCEFLANEDEVQRNRVLSAWMHEMFVEMTSKLESSADANEEIIQNCYILKSITGLFGLIMFTYKMSKELTSPVLKSEAFRYVENLCKNYGSEFKTECINAFNTDKSEYFKTTAGKVVLDMLDDVVKNKTHIKLLVLCMYKYGLAKSSTELNKLNKGDVREWVEHRILQSQMDCYEFER